MLQTVEGKPELGRDPNLKLQSKMKKIEKNQNPWRKRKLRLATSTQNEFN